MRQRRFLPGATFAGFLVAIAAVIAIGLVTYRSRTTSAVAGTQMAAAMTRLDQLDDLLAAVQDAETGQRGFLLTGEERYLEPYTEAQAQLAPRLAAVRGSFAGDVVKAGEIEELATLIAEKLTELRQTIELHRRDRAQAAMQAVLSDRGKNVMDRIRARAAQLEAESRAEIARSTEDWQAAVSLSLLITWVARRCCCFW